MINYDLLMGDISFYNRTLSFALRENAENGVAMLRLIEQLMAPWDEDYWRTACQNDTVPVNVRIVESKIIVHLVMVATVLSFFLFFVTVSSVLLNSLYVIYDRLVETLFSSGCGNNAAVPDDSTGLRKHFQTNSAVECSSAFF